jgi:hypothetical protein
MEMEEMIERLLAKMDADSKAWREEMAAEREAFRAETREPLAKKRWSPIQK